MRRYLRGRRRLVAFGVVVAAAAALATGAVAGGVFGGSDPASIFALQINGVAVHAASYQIDGAVIPAKGAKGTATQQYTVRITAPVTDDPALLQAFQAGQIPGDVVITVLDTEGRELRRYDFANAADVSYEDTGDRSTGTFQQHLVLTSNSLTTS